MSRTGIVSSCACMLIGMLILMSACDEFQPTPPANPVAEPGGALDGLRPLPLEDLPEWIRNGDWATVWAWVQTLSTDDLQRYGIMTDRGADPRTDIPEDYPNRTEVLEKIFRLGLFARGVESAGDQTEWLSQNGNREDGVLAFARADADGPDWGFGPDTEGSLDDGTCSEIPGPFRYAYYYLYRSSGASEGSVTPWSPPVAGPGENNRRIMVSTGVNTQFPSGGKICTMQIIYASATLPDGRILNGTSLVATHTGYHRGFTQGGTNYGQDVRPDGLPWWEREQHDDCISDDCAGFPPCPYNSVLEPDNVNPLPKYLLRGAGSNRYGDYFYTTCTPGCDSCWYLGLGDFICGPDGHCCSPDGSDYADSCFYTTGTHQAAIWTASDFPDPEDYYYTSTGNPSRSSPTGAGRRVDYGAGALVKQNPENHAKGGWMNQVVYQRPLSGGTYTYLDSDDATAPDASATVNGNSQNIGQFINISDSALWLGRELQVGCRPFWRWNISRSGSVVPYYLQLAIAGSTTCTSPILYNDWWITSAANPMNCTNFYAGSITYDFGNQVEHPPWKAHHLADPINNPDGRGWLHPSQCFLRQTPGANCDSYSNYNVTHYPLQTKLANGIDDAVSGYYAGTYLIVKYKIIPW